MSKDTKDTRKITVNSHVRRAPTRVVVLPAPTSVPAPPRPLLPRATSPTQESGYGAYDGPYPSTTPTGAHRYSDTIVDRNGFETEDGDTANGNGAQMDEEY